jgi:NADH dehydrogenase FAD-containing subunit
MSRKIEIVIVGGGSGASLASKLSAARAQFDPAKFNITLITPLPYNVFLLATARIVVTSEGSLDSTDQAFIPLDKVFNSEKGNAGRVLQGRVTNVLEDRVELDNGSSLRYDYLVLATGSLWTGPTNYSQYSSEGQVRSHVDKWRKKISSAKRIVIVGGGAVGIGMRPP